MAKLTFLGTGTSQGVPIIGCGCEVCRSDDPRDKRLRSAALVEFGGLTILIDAGPDFRTQMLRAGVRHLDAILLTHNHMDHTGGLDDVRSFNYIDRKPARIYCESKVLDSLKIFYSYAFAEHKYPGAPEWRISVIDNGPFLVLPNNTGELIWVHDFGYCTKMEDGSMVPCGNDIIKDALRPGDAPDVEGAVTVIPIRGYHDKMPVLGFRFGDIAYITDMSRIPQEEMYKLKDLKHLTLNTVSYRQHHSHFSLSEAVALAQETGAEHTWLTHLPHSFPRHEEFCKELPEGIAPAYDGLVIED
ncbi:MAG: MBL fold metallo-hydrolase [Bacteroidia bacterium]|nr:MBL fold metallo-hydrolase [Bacteroidia bacterium]